MIRFLHQPFLLIALLIVSLPACVGQRGKASPQGTKSKKAYGLFGEAMLAYDIRDDEKALELLRKAIKIDPNYADAYGLTGEIHLSNKNYEKAEEAIVKLLNLQPDNVYALIDLGNLQFEIDRYDDCIRTLNKLINLVGPSSVRDDAELKIASAKFAKNAMANPVPFNPVNLGPAINSELEEYFPGLSTDEQTFFFTRRDGRLNIYQQNEDIYFAQKGDTSWNKSLSLGKPVNTQENEGAFGASPDGKYLFFTSCSRPGGVGRCDIWFTRKVGNKWLEPENLGKPVNTVEWESQPTFSSDGKTLFFASNRSGGLGGSDIWYSLKTETGWSNPINLTVINTRGEEQFPFIHNDGKTLYFTSTGLPGMGKSDVFVTRFVNGKWQEPVNLGYPINTHEDEWNIIVNRTGDVAYFATNGIDNSYGGMDIYSMNLYEAARPNPTTYVHGIVFDVDTKKRLEADVELFDLSTEDRVAVTKSDPVNGEFLISIPANSNYAFEARAPGYLFHSENFELTTASLDKPFELEIGLKKIQKNVPIVLKNTFFDVDKWDLKKESRVELNLVIEFMKNNPTIKIEIGGHTDNTGDKTDNQKLSENRAKAVHDYLVSGGIDVTRLSYKGYGESVPVATNDTDEGRAKNRRTELKIVE